LVHQSINDVVRNPTLSDTLQKNIGNKKKTEKGEKIKKEKLTGRTNRKRKIPEIQSLAAKSEKSRSTEGVRHS
jgi:hypothetical protein